ncbi:DNA methyltransferase [Limosilactobacillus reuteri]|uniref:DNA methylase N-4/N-6 domain-containing protein n=1 Tax=Limosilactobacillus reuteri TaxID=1598 RepID=A0A256SPZ9_LIMRT|nr:DNA methyltransferase [Limosilactobacillus reuteri]OYS68659.1 hypothetical protein CBF96_07160 [Limosilactobacillus reuteri]
MYNFPEGFLNNKVRPNNKKIDERIEKLDDRGRLSNPVFKAFAYPSKIFYPNIQKFIRLYSNEGDVVLDSFAGSGSTGIASLLEGRKSVLIDDSPYANFIEKNVFSKVDLNKVEVAYQRLVRELEPIINRIYKTRTSDGKWGILQSLITSNLYSCPSCNKVMDLNNKETGKRSEYECPNCGNVINIATTEIKGRKVADREPIEVVVKYKNDEGKVKKETRQVTEDDKVTWDGNIRAVKENFDGLWEPATEIVYNRSYPRVGGWPGFPIHSKVGALFSQKNLLALKIINQYIEKINDKEVKTFFKYVFTESLFRSSKRLFKTSGIKNVYHIPPIGKEQNVFVVFNRKYKTILKGKKFLNAKIQNKGFNDVICIKGNSRKLNFKDNIFDYAFIDPPYGGVVPYAELNLFYSAWLNEDEDLKNEVNIPMDYDKKQEWADKWGKMIYESFNEVFRTLKPGSYMTIVFQSKFDTIWNELKKVLIQKIGFKFVSFTSNNRGTTFHTNSLDDTNPKSAFITYQKPLTKIRDKTQEIRTDVFDLVPNDYLNRDLSFREIQDYLIGIAMSNDSVTIPSDHEIKEWLKSKKYYLR